MSMCSFFKALLILCIIFFILQFPLCPLTCFICAEMRQGVDASSRTVIDTQPSPLPFPEQCLDMRCQITFRVTQIQARVMAQEVKTLAVQA